MTEVGVKCGRCGGPVYMVTCDQVRGTGHEWVLYSRCDGECGDIYVLPGDACHDCEEDPCAS